MRPSTRAVRTAIAACTCACALALALALALGAAAAEADTDYNLGVQAYRSEDYATARVHWAKAVQQDELGAFNNLGFLLYNGLGGAEDAAGAVVLWRSAAERGHSEAQWHLGDALEKGRGVPRDAVAAYAWYRCAAAPRIKPLRDDDEEVRTAIARDAAQSLATLIGTLEPAQLDAGEKLARLQIGKYVP